MGFSLWTLETLALGAAAYAGASRCTPAKEVLHRALVTLLFALALALALLYALGAVGQIRQLPVALAGATLSGTLLGRCLRGEGGRKVREAFTLDVGAPLRLLKAAWTERELAAYVWAPAVLAVGVSLFIAWRFPSWSWDCVWYHVPMSDYVLQTHGNGWVATNDHYINGYPRNVELLSVWSSVLLGSTRLDDVAQFPFALLGALGVAAFCRRLGVRPPLAAAAGAMWLLTPAVCLQLQTTHADIAAGALFIVAMYFLTSEQFTPWAQAMTFLCLGLYAGAKVTGLFHALLLSPLLVVRTLSAVRRAPRKAHAFGILALCLAVAVALGGFSYLRGLARFGNPFWPVRVSVPFFGTLTGPIDPKDMAWPPAFFGAPGAFHEMLRRWYTPSGNYYPDVREGPFGILFAFLTLPCFCLFALLAPFVRERRAWLPVVALGVLAVLVPVAWWGRYVLAMAAAALVAFAVLHSRLPWAWLRPVASAAAAFLSVASYAAAVPGYRVLPTPFANSEVARSDDARLRQELDWLWPAPLASYRDAELHAGDVVVYDDSIMFLSELWTEDLRNRVEYVQDDGDDGAYVQRLRALKPAWICVGAGTRAESVLRSRPDLFRFLFPVPKSTGRMYRVLQSDF